MRRLIKFALLPAIAGTLIALGMVALSLNLPYRGFQNDAFLHIERGTGTLEIGRALAQVGAIRYPWQFWAERALHSDGKIQAGEYKFSEAASAAVIFDRLARGDVSFFELTVKEGSNMFDIAQLLATAGVMPAADFLRAAANPALILDLAPQAPSLEGYLFPSTYRISHAATAADLCRQMTEQFRKQWRPEAPSVCKVTRTATNGSTCTAWSRSPRWSKRKPASQPSGRWSRVCSRIAWT